MLLTVTGALSVLVGLSFSGASPAGYAAPSQRLMVQTEGEFVANLVLLDERGATRGRLGAVTGSNGWISVARQGMAFSYVAPTRTIEIPPGVDVPPGLRRQLERRPQAALALGSFLFDSLVSAGSGYSFSYGFGGKVVSAVPGRTAWSRDGRRVVLSQARRGRVHLVAHDLTTRSTRLLTQSPGRDLNPRFSPDGRMVVFERHVAGAANLYSVRPDGSGLRQLTYWSGDELAPDFAPDGRSLVFSSNATGRFQLYVMEVTTSEVRRLTSNVGNDRRPVWSPDGRWIAFSSDRDGDSDVFLVDPTGARERKLTRNASEDLVQDWQPLRDTTPPAIRALPSAGPREQTLELRYRLRDESGVARIVGEIDMGNTHVGVGPSRSTGGVVRTRPTRVHVLRVPYSELTMGFGDEQERVPPQRFRFCLAAVDPFGNASGVTCATYRFR